MAKKRVRKVSVKKAAPRRAMRSDVIKDIFVQPTEPLLDYRPLLAQMLQEAEMRAASAEQKYNEIARKLTGLLTVDQVEHARVAGCSPEVYAIEFIELAKDKFFPKFEAAVRPLSELKIGAF